MQRDAGNNTGGRRTRRGAARAVAVLLVFLAGCRTLPETKFFTYESERHHFQVDLPEAARGRIDYRMQTVATTAGPVRRGAYTARWEGLVFEVRTTRIPADFSAAQAGALAAHAAAPRGGAALVQGRRVIDGLNARALRMKLSRGRVQEGAVVSVGDLLYELRVTAPRESDLDEPAARRFFGSVKFTRGLLRPDAEREARKRIPREFQGADAQPEPEPPAPPEYYTLDRADLGFTMELPQALRHVADDGLTLEGTDLKGRAVLASAPDMQFTAAVFPEALEPGVPPRKLLQSVRDHIAGQAVQIITEAIYPSQYDGGLQMRYVTEQDGVPEFRMLRAVLQGRTLFLVYASSPDEAVFQGPDFQHIFDTFTILNAETSGK